MSMFNADDVKAGTVAVCVCHGACPPVLKNIQLLYKGCSIIVTSVSISASDKERRLHVSISTVSQSTRSLFTHIQAQKHNRFLRERDGAVAFPCMNVQSPWLTTATTPPHSHSSTVCLQGLIGVPLPTPHQLLDCQKTPTLPFIQFRVLGIGCVLIFFSPLG